MADQIGELARASNRVVIWSRDGHPVAASRNLRAILRYGREHDACVVLARIAHAERGGGRLTLQWSDGAFTRTWFASFGVLERWINRPSLKTPSGEYEVIEGGYNLTRRYDGQHSR